MKQSLSLLASALLVVSFSSFAADAEMDSKAAAKPADAAMVDSKDDAKKDKKDENKDKAAMHSTTSK